MLQCHILSEHCVSASSSTRFFKVILLVICFHKHKVRYHHRIQTQTIHKEWIITFLKKIQINKDKIKINYRNIYNIAQLNTIHSIHTFAQSLQTQPFISNKTATESNSTPLVLSFLFTCFYCQHLINFSICF